MSDERFGITDGTDEYDGAGGVGWTGGIDWTTVGLTFDHITNVNIVSVLDGQILVYNSATSLWENTAPSALDTKVTVFEADVQVGSVSRQINFDGTDFDVTEDAGNDWFLVEFAGSGMATHDIVGAWHTESGLTTGHFLKATGTTTFAFGAHGLGASDVGAYTTAQTDTAIDTDITTHTGLGSAHHVKYLDSEAVSAVEAANPLTLTYNLTVTGGQILSGADSTKPGITLDSIGSGDTWTAQGAFVYLGEQASSGDSGQYRVALTYQGDGKGYLGMGVVTGGVPAECAVEMSGASSIFQYANQSFVINQDNIMARLGGGTPSSFGTAQYMLQLLGNAGTTTGPHLALVLNEPTDRPAWAMFIAARDNISMSFDGYFDGTNWVSADVGSNYAIMKGNTAVVGADDRLAFLVESGIAAGSTITWDVMAFFDSSSNLTLNGDLIMGTNELQFSTATVHSSGTDIHIHPNSGNADGILIIHPLGSNTASSITLRNSATANYGATQWVISGTTVSLTSSLGGSGTAPTTLNLNDSDWDTIAIGDASASVTLGSLAITTIVAGVSDYDKFLVSDSSTVKFRTGAEMLSDIGAAAASHGSSAHTGDVLPGANQDLGAYYLDIDDIGVPANPGATIRRLFVDTATGELSVRTSGGSTVSLEGAGGGPGSGTQWTLPVWDTTTTLGDSMVSQDSGGTLLTVDGDLDVDGGNLRVDDAYHSTTLSNITGNSANWPVKIVPPYLTNNDYVPLIEVYVANNIPTKPRVGIWAKLASDDSRLYFGTQNSSAAGITAYGSYVDKDGNWILEGSLTAGSIVAGVSDYDEFLVSDSGLVKFRTGAELLSDIGAASDSHGASAHSGDVLPAANQDLGAFYFDIDDISTPADPASTIRRLFVDTATGKLSVRTNASTTISLEEQGGTDADAIHDNVAGEINAIADKASPVGADVIVIEDSAGGSWTKKKVSITNLPGGADADAIHDNVLNEIQVITGKGTPVGADVIIIEDSAASWAKKSVTISNLPAGSPSFGSPTGGIDIGDSAVEGSSGDSTRADHQHQFTAPSAGYPLDTANTESDGTASTPARSDHIHRLGAHIHTATAGEGGQLDWDNVWSDAVHSHASDGEGSTLTWANALAVAAAGSHDHSDNTAGDAVPEASITFSATGHDHDGSGSENVDYTNLDSIPSTFAPSSHGSSDHTGAIFAGANDDLGAFYLDIDDIAVPANPGATIRRLFVNTATGKLSVRTNGGTTISLEEQGGADPDAIHDNVANEITTITAKTSLAAADEFVLEDSGATFVKKAVTFANFESSLSLANLGTRTHASLSDNPTDAHHTEGHVLAVTGPHTGSLPLTDLDPAGAGQGSIMRYGASDWEVLTKGTNTYVLKSGATTIAWGQVDYSELVGTQPAPVAHVLATSGPHTDTLPLTDLAVGSQGSVIIRGAADWEELTLSTTNFALVCTATDAAWAQYDYSWLANIPSTFAAAAHDLTSAYHTDSGLTTGWFLKADSTTTFSFQAHGLTASDVSALAEVVDDTSPQLGGDLDLNEKCILMDPSLTTNLEYEGTVLELTVSGLTVGQCVYVSGNNTGALADADAVGTMPAIGVFVGTNLVLTHGVVRQDTWTWTAGQRLYVGTDGNLTSTAPSGSGDYVQIMGIAVNVDAVMIMPSLTEVKVA